jgi:hypothetical protein
LHVKIDFGNPAASVTTLDTTDSVGDVSLDPPDTLNVSATGNLTIAGPAVSTVAGTLSNAGAITVSGGTTHIAKGIDGTGSITVSASAALTAAYIRQSALTVSGSAQLDAGGGIAGTSKVSSLTVGGRLDLTDNKLIVASGTVGSWNGVNYDGVAGLIKAGRNFGSWDGSGIITSMTAAGAPNSVASLAVAAAGDVGYGGTRTFGGQSVAAGDVLVMYTYTGDANLSGKIDADDYFQIDSHYNKSADSAKSWLNGDFNYDGKINGDDYFLIDNAYAGQGAPLSTGPQAISVSAVPEPVGFVLLGAMSLVTRRKRR